MDQARRTGRPVPPDVRAVFDVWPAARPYLELYTELDQRRTVGGMGAGPQPIAASETLIVARAFGLNRRLALRLVGAMDREARAHYARQAAQDDDETD